MLGLRVIFAWGNGLDLNGTRGDPMRVAVTVVFALMVATPSEASKSCMSKTEARQHFGSVHIYWHGPAHCWDATSTRRHHQIHQIHQTHQVRQKKNDPNWHDAMSEMLPDGGSASASTRLARAPTQLAGARTQLAAAPTQLAPAPTPWVNRWVDLEQSPIISRWVDIVQVAPPLVIRAAEPLVTPRGVVMVIMFVVGSLAIVILLQRPPSRRNRRSTGWEGVDDPDPAE
jgi:hypothetical protein